MIVKRLANHVIVEFPLRLIPLAPALPTCGTNGPLEPVFSQPPTRC